jgi:hypothetical protein
LGIHQGEFEDYIKFSIDNVETGRVAPPNGGFWELGNFSSTLTNIWANGTKMAPFDHEVSDKSLLLLKMRNYLKFDSFFSF